MKYTITKNILNYSYGARVTWADQGYGVSQFVSFIADGDTTISAKPTILDPNSNVDWWADSNNWNVQGSVENNNAKDILLNHKGLTKDYRSSTTIYINNGPSMQRFIINPTATNREKLKEFIAKEIHLAGANSDGNIGDYEIYASTTKDMEVERLPNHSSWILVAKGELTQDGILKNISEKSFRFTLLKIHAKAKNKSYMECAAVKIYGLEKEPTEKFLIQDGILIKGIKDGQLVNIREGY